MITLPKKTHQSGFSLIEIAIVLVIIGLLLGGVMKGQTMVQNTKIKRIATDTQSVQASIHAYSDTYWQLPGDDSGAATRFGLIATANSGGGDGIIGGVFDSAVAGVESQLAWNHLRCANLIKGTCVTTASSIATLSRNPVGGTVGIADGRGGTALLGLTTLVVCMTSMPAAIAESYDTLQDDGVGTSGDIRGSGNAQTSATPGTVAAYAAGNIIHICSGF